MSDAAVGLGLNRWDVADPRRFAANVARAEALGVTHALLGTNPLRVPDPYVCLARAAEQTSTITVAPFVENPVLRHPAVSANSIATVDGLAPGRTQLVYGAGDTAVRFLALRPSTVSGLGEAVTLARSLLAGAPLDAGAGRPVALANARPVPVWVAASGPRTLRMAGQLADGVYLRVGASRAGLRHAVELVREGARAAQRDPAQIRIGVVVHVVTDQSAERAAAIGRAIAAGFYEYSPGLFAAAGVAWDGPPIDELRVGVWPDFHHTDDLVAAGDRVRHLSGDVIDAFAVTGSPAEIAGRLRMIIAAVPNLDVLVVNPMPYPRPALAYAQYFTEQIWPAVQ